MHAWRHAAVDGGWLAPDTNRAKKTRMPGIDWKRHAGR
jgi:hypothetical protein